MLNRLKRFRIALGYDQQTMGTILGVKQNTYSQIENGRRQLTDNHIRLMEERAHINKEWLLTGEGPMFSETEDEKRLVDLFTSMSPSNQEYLLKYAKMMLEMEQRENS